MTTYHKSLHLNEDQLAPYDPACPFCGSSDRKRIGRLQANPEVFILECNSCHASSASRMPTINTLEKYYSNGYYDFISKIGTEKRVTIDISKKLAKHILKKIKKHNKIMENVDILDFGGGDGSISIDLAEEFLKCGSNNVNIILIEYNDKIASNKNKNISIIRKANIEEIKQKNFDIVIASTVIEHLPQPKKILEDLLSLTKNGGIFHARTPYILPFLKFLSAIRHNLDMFTFPDHLHDLGPFFWNNYFSNRDDFEIISSNPSIVETSIKNHFFLTIAAYILKFPWYIFGNNYKLVGGWEIYSKKIM